MPRCVCALGLSALYILCLSVLSDPNLQHVNITISCYTAVPFFGSSVTNFIKLTHMPYLRHDTVKSLYRYGLHFISLNLLAVTISKVFATFSCHGIVPPSLLYFYVYR